MGGYLVNLFKSPPANVDDFMSADVLENQVKDTNVIRNVVWSNFDRVEIRNIIDFKNYRIAEDSEKFWIGERQFALLYDLIDRADSRLFYKEDKTVKNRCFFTFRPHSGEMYCNNKAGYRFYNYPGNF